MASDSSSIDHFLSGSTPHIFQGFAECWKTYIDDARNQQFLESWNKILLENKLKWKRSDIIQNVSLVVREVGGSPLLIILRCVDAVAGLYQCFAAKEAIAILLSSFSENVTFGIFNHVDEVILFRILTVVKKLKL